MVVTLLITCDKCVFVDVSEEVKGTFYYTHILDIMSGQGRHLSGQNTFSSLSQAPTLMISLKCHKFAQVVLLLT